MWMFGNWMSLRFIQFPKVLDNKFQSVNISKIFKMKKIIFIATVLFTLFYTNATAQNEAIYNHYIVNPILINPSVAGFDNIHKVHANARVQWVSFPGAPKTYSLTYNGPIGKTFGIGGMIFQENIASLTRSRLQLDFAFRYKLENLRFAFGFATEFGQDRVPSSVIENPFFQEGDIITQDYVDGRGRFDATLGGFLMFKERTFVGLSFPGLISSRIGDTVTPGDDSSLFNHYVLQAGHRFGVDNYNVILEPSIVVKQVRNTPFKVDFNMKATFLDELITTGLTYRAGTGGALGLLVGTKIDDFRIFYSYDVSFQRFQVYNTGSHEVTVSFQFAGKKDNEIR